jgi:hypothetical protein
MCCDCGGRLSDCCCCCCCCCLDFPFVTFSLLADVQRCVWSAPFGTGACRTSSLLHDDGSAQFEGLLKRNLKGRKKILSQCYTVRHKWQWNAVGRNPRHRGENLRTENVRHGAGIVCYLRTLCLDCSPFCICEKACDRGECSREWGQ